jgi:hypothetical protein
MERPEEMKLYSYVVEHDNGYGPNPYFRFCTLCGCKFKGGKNIVQLAKAGDWVVGTGGASEKSAGHGRLVYAMRVDEKLTRWKYFSDSRFERKKPPRGGKTATYEQARGDNQDPRKDGENDFWREAPQLSDRKHKQFVLVSKHFYYFGAEAKKMDDIPKEFHLEKRGPGFRSDFDLADIRRFLEWLKKQSKPGKHGEPCNKKLAEEPKESSSTCK